MDELVGAIQLFEKSLPEAFPESRLHLLLRSVENGRERRDLGEISETGHLLQCRLRLSRQTDELPDHEVHHIVGVSLGVNAIDIPRPAPSIMIEGKHFFFGERRNELNGEERIATRLLLNQLREWHVLFRLTVKRVRKQLSEMLLCERPERDLVHLSPGTPDRLKLTHQRMSGIDFIVTVSANHHEVL